MQNDEYMKAYEREWEKMLGAKQIEITKEEREELRRLIQHEKEGNE
jgi:hypothetical protein